MTANLINKLNGTLTVIMIKGASSIELIYFFKRLEKWQL